MSETKFQVILFSDCDLKDTFFDSLKQDYPGFEGWFNDKISQGASAYVYQDVRMKAFVYLKYGECEEIVLQDKVLPPVARIKIGTLKLSEEIQGERLGEGAIGLALWAWQKSECDEIYVTVFDKHKKLIDMLRKFGFILQGYKPPDSKGEAEGVYVKSKNHLDRTNAYTMFPYLDCSKLEYARVLPIFPNYHDTLFPYSTLARTEQEGDQIAAANGITKVYVAFNKIVGSWDIGKPVMIYRMAKENEIKKYHSVITSFGTICDLQIVKADGISKLSLEEFLQITGNKTVFSENDLRRWYSGQANVVLVTMVYNGYFGAGHNVSLDVLRKNHFWGQGGDNRKPYEYIYRAESFKKILGLGGIVPNTVIR